MDANSICCFQEPAADSRGYAFIRSKISFKSLAGRHMPCLMDREQGDLVCKDEVFAVVGCAMEVLNTLGHGLSEKPYENAMVVELGLRAIPFVQQPRFDVTYKGVRVGEFIPDLIVFEGVVVDAKVVEKIADHETGQMINYLKVTRLKVGVLLNFRHARLEWKRVVLEKQTANPRE